MKRIINIRNSYGTEYKYILTNEYRDFGVYKEKTPNGFFMNQSWLISNNENAKLVIDTYNRLCKEEVLDIIDNYCETGKFGVKAVMHCGSLHMHRSGRLV